MIRWPWVSRRAYDLLGVVNEQVVAQNAMLIADLTRIRRFESGLTEVRRPERAALEPMPQELYEYIKGWGSEAIRREQRAQAYRRHQRGEKWDDIKADMMAPDVPRDTGLEQGEESG